MSSLSGPETLPFLASYDNTSADSFFTLAKSTTIKSSFENGRRDRASLPVEFTNMKINFSAS